MKVAKLPIQVVVNPYLFYLLKRMIEFDVEISMRKLISENNDSFQKGSLHERNIERRIYPVTPHQAIAEHIDKYNKSYIKSAGAYVIRSMWNNATFFFSKRHLDAMTRSVQSLGKFSSWDDFCQKFSKHRYYEKSERFTGLKPNEITAKDWIYIKKIVDERFIALQSRFSQEGRLGIAKHNVFYEDSKPNLVRFATEQDMIDIHNLAERVYPCPHNDAEVRASWHRKNQKICLVCFDPYGEILGTLTALPIKSTFYNKLKKGETTEGEMTTDDIFSLEEKQGVGRIYIESFAALSPKVQYELRRAYIRMFANFCDIENDEIIVCAIGGSPKSQSVLEGYGMKAVSEVPEPRAGKFFPFFETTLGNFKASLEKKIAETETVYKL